MSSRRFHHPARFALALIGLALSGAAAAQSQPVVEVFGLSTMPLMNVGDARVYYLDALVQLEAHLSAELPADPTRAQALVQQRIKGLGPRLNQQTQNAGDGLARAFQLGIDRAPAILFDGKWIVYGVLDVGEARRIFNAWRTTRGAQLIGTNRP